MVAPDDWRVLTAERLKGCSFRWKKYYRRSERWDHDHCGARWAKFMLAEGCLQEGYEVTDSYKHGADYEWICESCFEELREIMNWSVVQ